MIRDLGDWTFPDRPAQGAHNDVTVNSGPRMIEDHMPDELKEIYFQPGYRFRIVKSVPIHLCKLLEYSDTNISPVLGDLSSPFWRILH